MFVQNLGQADCSFVNDDDDDDVEKDSVTSYGQIVLIDEKKNHFLDTNLSVLCQ